jgi:hypothetical protein
MMVMTDDDGPNRKLSLALGSGPPSRPEMAPSYQLGFAQVFAMELLRVRGSRAVAFELTTKYRRSPSSIDSGAEWFENIRNLANSCTSFCGPYLILTLTVGSVISGFELLCQDPIPGLAALKTRCTPS